MPESDDEVRADAPGLNDLIQVYMATTTRTRPVATHIVTLAMRGSGARDLSQFLAAVRALSAPAIGLSGTQVVDWFYLTTLMTATAAGRQTLVEAGRRMALVEAETAPTSH